MDCIFVSTKLQALLVSYLVDHGYISKRYIFVKLTQSRARSSIDSQWRIVRCLEKRAFFTVNICESDGFVGNLLKTCLLTFLAAFSGGYLYAAYITSYLISTAIYIVPFSRLKTYDEGGFNINKNSVLYSDEPIVGNSLMHRFVRHQMPKGAAFYNREQSRQHHTIFKNADNVVSKERLIYHQIDWSAYLEPQDIAALPEVVFNVMLGTAFQDFPDKRQLLGLFNQYIRKCQLYLPHPRDNELHDVKGMVAVLSPAEAVLLSLCQLQNITVYHFGSTVALNLAEVESIKFVNLLDIIVKNNGSFPECVGRLNSGS